jgi:uncharacterized protein (DUF362 family)
MDRRDFIKKSVLAGVAGSTLPFIKYKNIFANTSLSETQYDLVAVKGGEPEEMFDKAIAEFGGIKKFIRKGQKVLVKPNIGWDVIPENSANTNPKLVKRIIEQCFNAGAKDVYVFDHTCDNWNKCYTNSGIEKAVTDAGGKIVSGANESYYHEVKIPNGKNLKDSKVHELVLDSDVFINVPVLKNHGGSRLTICMKNMMGVVWDRGYWHRNDLHQCIADFATYCKPTLNVVDAYNVMKRYGPRGVSKEDVVNMKSLLISTNMVVADAAAAKIFGMEPEDINYIKYADEMKVGSMNLENLSIKRIKI